MNENAIGEHDVTGSLQVIKFEALAKEWRNAKLAGQISVQVYPWKFEELKFCGDRRERLS
jgi:hypothetical protein